MVKSFLSTLVHLGPVNIITVLLYKLAIRSRLFEAWLPIGQAYQEPLFNFASPTTGDILISEPSKTSIIQEAEELRNGRMRLFSNQFFQVASPPDWFVNPIIGKRLSHPEVHWSRLSDFDLEIGDIKCIWELSRFDWALLLARAYRLTGDQRYVTLLNQWASDWIAQNPLNMGPNWKCGQETAIRMMQTLLAAFIIEQHNTTTPGLIRFITEHCARIAPTIRYAMAQDNNHGTSEAAGLYLGGAWLLACAKDEHTRSAKQALSWYQLGRRWLENRVRHLIAPDGSFSQYSLNYHRVLLDTLNLVEFWRRELKLPAFSDRYCERARAAVNWLYQMIDPKTGDGPNLGANDGARLFVLSATDYRDYRPSVQLGAALFFGKKAYEEGIWDEPLLWLGFKQVEGMYLSGEAGNSPPGRGKGWVKNLYKQQNVCNPPLSPPRRGIPPQADSNFFKTSCIMPDGGYVIINAPGANGNIARGIIRFPNFRFRPAHADALHFDLWYKGINILRDSGTYSYNAEPVWQQYFPGTAAHNTVQFDGRDQMPRLGRFLFGEWLQMQQPGELLYHGDTLSWTAAYTDYKKCRHKRTVLASGLVWKIVDEIEGFTTSAVLRWRLAPGSWRIDGMNCIGKLAEFSIQCTTPITRFELVEGCESRYYQEKVTLPVLEIQVAPGKAMLTTEIDLKP
jgi:hypothetical protein